MTRHILFIVTSYWAYGELLIAVEFAKRARCARYEPIFLIPPSHAKIMRDYGFNHSVLIPKSGNINRILLQDIRDFYDPELVILADFLNYHFCEQQYGLTIDDLKFSAGRVGTFDNFDWERTHAKLDTYGFRAKRHGILGLDTYAFRLQPCPLNWPAQAAHSTTHYYALMDSPQWPNDDARRQARRALGLTQEKVVLLTTARWQHTHAAYPRVERFVEACTAMLERIIERLDDQTVVISIGPQMLFHKRAPAHFRAYEQVSPNTFATYMAAADLFLANNIGSTTFHRAVLSGIPAIALFSSLYKIDGECRSAEPSRSMINLSPFAEQLIAEIEYCYPFRMFPVGWYYFLNSLVRGNPFCESLRQIELFDEDGCLEGITRLLYDSDARAVLRQRIGAYLDMLARLPTVKDVLDTLVATCS